MGEVLADVLAAAHRLAPREIPALVQDAALRLGLSEARVFVADVQQHQLIALPSPDQTALLVAGSPVELETIAVDTSLGGRAYRTETVQLAADTGSSGTGPSGIVGWLPLVDGIERLGVLKIAAPALGAPLLERCRALASLIAMILVAKLHYSDVLARTVRSRPMALQAELLWAFVPPRTIGTTAVTSSAVLEPAYEVGGDAFDHTLAGTHLHLTLLDAMGHDLASGGCSAVALAACRSTRRAGGGLTDIAEQIDRTLARWIPDRLLTCVIADLDTVTGRFDWINCGHLAPLLIRDGRIVTGALDRHPHLPLGLGDTGLPPPQVHTLRLQPGDRVLTFTDGVTEARSATGELFGENRLADTVVRAMADGLPAPEALRRLIQRILLHQDQQLRDDATILLTEWHPHTAGPT
ncbi:PP2C family protein-serine/threonine phosphatase [Kitasatospora sp. A2-31]|uniref:PP2C family protein-serine/threonine phosphatase n=1 Tax=Kitasatospora sp. A2-31 TaxID=2916414 RepID=UPI001EED08E4|nr:PP2C family protein-serine/threonine phosphatase [Kitasatospora sp. A2-31]MCG6499834.1 serine/threonine-protein phosphatase [Kitasatospora sp. A2-31]MCG6499879.1 serine/threonine-protein phosphatase [Kitasatospora sp. A2-31]